ncbi:hypothetical protein SB786_25865 [Burkholderia sp. SIMBA_062]
MDLFVWIGAAIACHHQFVIAIKSRLDDAQHDEAGHHAGKNERRDTVRAQQPFRIGAREGANAMLGNAGLQIARREVW